jgi:hypothetical protein
MAAHYVARYKKLEGKPEDVRRNTAHAAVEFMMTQSPVPPSPDVDPGALAIVQRGYLDSDEAVFATWRAGRA